MTIVNRYASYMLRLQWMQNDDCPTWVVSMQSTKTGETRWFSDLDALYQFLRIEFALCKQMKDASLPVPQVAENMALLGKDVCDPDRP